MIFVVTTPVGGIGGGNFDIAPGKSSESESDADSSDADCAAGGGGEALADAACNIEVAVSSAPNRCQGGVSGCLGSGAARILVLGLARCAGGSIGTFVTVGRSAAPLLACCAGGVIGSAVAG